MRPTSRWPYMNPESGPSERNPYGANEAVPYMNPDSGVFGGEAIADGQC